MSEAAAAAAEEEEEETWVAIQRLPTYDRLRRAMLKKALDNGSFVHGEVDVTKLEPREKQHLVESLLKLVEEDNGKFLRRIRERTDRCDH